MIENREMWEWVFKTSTPDLLKKLRKILNKLPGKVTYGREFIYSTGTIPILLVAHVDTVHKTLPTQLYFDERNKILWSPQGCGADDRAGVLAILELLSRGYKPHVLFVDGEERGSTGAKELVQKVHDPGIRYVIEIDRKGDREAVFYSVSTKPFEDYVLGFGFKRDTGSFTDITTICPAWGVCGVNLSAGYSNQHSDREILNLDWLENTILQVESMLQNPPAKRFRLPIIVTAPSRVVRHVYNEKDETYKTGTGTGARTGDYKNKGGDAFGKTFWIFLDYGDIIKEFGGTVFQWEYWLTKKYLYIFDELELSAMDAIHAMVKAGYGPAGVKPKKEDKATKTATTVQAGGSTELKGGLAVVKN